VRVAAPRLASGSWRNGSAVGFSWLQVRGLPRSVASKSVLPNNRLQADRPQRSGGARIKPGSRPHRACHGAGCRSILGGNKAAGR